MPDPTEIDIVVRVRDGALSERGFVARFPNVFDKYTVPPTQSFELMKMWKSALMDWWQTQLNFAMWIASVGCGVSAGHHMQAEDPMIRVVYRFHFYYTIRRVLPKMGTPFPGDTASDPTKNPYDRQAYKRVCNEFVVSFHTDWHIPGANSGLGTMNIYQHRRLAWGMTTGL